MLHRDLKGANVLLTGSGDVKVTDFGLAAPAPDDTKAGGWLTAETGTYRWMAPEVTRHEGYTKSADVFSYGMLLFELISHEVPFADRPPLQAAGAGVGLRAPGVEQQLDGRGDVHLRSQLRLCGRRRLTECSA